MSFHEVFFNQIDDNKGLLKTFHQLISLGNYSLLKILINDYDDDVFHQNFLLNFVVFIANILARRIFGLDDYAQQTGIVWPAASQQHHQRGCQSAHEIK